MYDRQTSRAVTAALLALQRRANSLDTETKEHRHQAACLATTLTEAEKRIFDVTLAASTASTEAASKISLRVALLEGEIDRGEREVSSMREELITLREERERQRGRVDVASDRRDLAEEKEQVEEKSLKNTDTALSIVTGRLAAISAALGRIRPLNAELVNAIQGKVERAQAQHDEIITHRKQLEENINSTLEQLGSSLTYLGNTLNLMDDDDEDKRHVLESLHILQGTPAWRRCADGVQAGIDCRYHMRSFATKHTDRGHLSKVANQGFRAVSFGSTRRDENPITENLGSTTQKQIRMPEYTGRATSSPAAVQDTRRTFERKTLFKRKHKLLPENLHPRETTSSRKLQDKSAQSSTLVEESNRSSSLVGEKEAWETDQDFSSRREAWDRMLKQQQEQSGSLKDILTQQANLTKEREDHLTAYTVSSRHLLVPKEGQQSEDEHSCHQRDATYARNDLETIRLRQARAHNPQDSPPPALSPRTSPNIDNFELDVPRSKSIDVRIQKKKSNQKSTENMFIAVDDVLDEVATVSRSSKRIQRKKVSKKMPTTIDSKIDGAHQKNTSKKIKPKTRDGLFTWLP